jgi:hypothetical protein
MKSFSVAIAFALLAGLGVLAGKSNILVSDSVKRNLKTSNF